MTIRSAYSNWATTYDSDRNLTRDLDEVVTRQALEHQRFAAILELGCGTGKNTPAYAGVAARVLSLDLTERMIRRAKAKVEQDNVLFAIADLTRPWPCAAGSVDLVACNLVLEHVADLAFVFAEASRVLVEQGHFFISELHPFRQYLGKKATFQRDGQQTEIPAFVHHISAFLDAAQYAGFRLARLGEWWHDEDEGAPPRLVSFMFAK